MKKVLVVNDNSIMNVLHSRYLKEAGYRTVAAYDGVDAINALKNENRISGMLLDIYMPRKDGFEVLRYMKNRDMDIPVIVTSMMDASEIQGKLDSIKYPVDIERDTEKVTSLMKKKIG